MVIDHGKLFMKMKSNVSLPHLQANINNIVGYSVLMACSINLSENFDQYM